MDYSSKAITEMYDELKAVSDVHGFAARGSTLFSSAGLTANFGSTYWYWAEDGAWNTCEDGGFSPDCPPY